MSALHLDQLTFQKLLPVLQRDGGIRWDWRSFSRFLLDRFADPIRNGLPVKESNATLHQKLDHIGGSTMANHTYLVEHNIDFKEFASC
ncbi:hypothetical protein [Shimia sp. R9_3]|uniref:hypothetical protein n=1 Tax=Shimia sp. R9_3 TaxID=2821113 RepID=UPI001AD9D17E|nr:hypothetical protein [Shimia sp. R9_3]MBO9400865.1 hypothetical protein [Shimia sp. R9_3]